MIVGAVADIVRLPLDVRRSIACGDNVGRGADDPIPGVPRQRSGAIRGKDFPRVPGGDLRPRLVEGILF